MTDLPRPLIGWRVWRVTPRGLCSAVLRQVWEPVTKATCKTELYVNVPKLRCRQGGGRVPHSDGSGYCGLYGKFAPEHWERDIASAGQVFGAFEGWGKVVEHDIGFRAEFGQPLLVCFAPELLREPDMLPAWLARYEVPLVEVKTVEREPDGVQQQAWSAASAMMGRGRTRLGTYQAWPVGTLEDIRREHGL